jgi:circadian clock protein KaiC
MDTWISLRDHEANGERNRLLYLLKSRGMNHSKQLREYHLTDDGIELVDAYIGAEGVLTGAARLAQEARERDAGNARAEAIERRRREMARKRASVERAIADMQADLETEEAEMKMLIEQEEAQEVVFADDRSRMATRRGVTS